MGNLFSRQAEGPTEFTTEWIENLYAASNAVHSERPNFDAPSDGFDDAKGDDAEAKGEEQDPNASIEDEDELKRCTSKNDQGRAIYSTDNFSPVRGTNNITIPIDPREAATVHFTIGIRSATLQTHDALKTGIDKLKYIDLVVVASAVSEWIKTHPWETAAIVVPLILLACTPAFLGLAGFTAGGVAAGSIAAGIQAGIGSVAAGSVFATLTSAAMGGYGVPIVFGGVWLTSSAVMWGIAVWQEWCKGDGDDTGDGGDVEEDDSRALVLRT